MDTILGTEIKLYFLSLSSLWILKNKMAKRLLKLENEKSDWQTGFLKLCE